ncbi:MAG TPA: L-threonylcarbamoyladenylate synthase [Hydrogenophilus thermoluteolus]|nr:L-threonylcarbamoyladenylate synthase [Hydrogenophilus thermoluteolus]
MTAKRIPLDPRNPQPRGIAQLAQILANGGIVAIPTDASYSLVWPVGDANALVQVRRLRGVDDNHLFTLFCPDLSILGQYARVDNQQYRLLKLGTPGPFTFILEGTHELPRRVLHPKRRTIGLRVPDHPVVQALLTAHNAPLLTTTVQPTGAEEPLSDPDAILDQLGHVLAAVVDTEEMPQGATTIIDLTERPPVIRRLGLGDPARLGLEVVESET